MQGDKYATNCENLWEAPSFGRQGKRAKKFQVMEKATIKAYQFRSSPTLFGIQCRSLT